MDTFDSYRSSVPARLPASRSGALAPRGSSGLPEASPQSPLSLRVALRGARRYWWLVLMLWVVGSAGIGAAIYLKVKPSYKAYAYLRAEPSKDDIFGVKSTGETFDLYLQTQVSLIKSPNVLTAAGAKSKVTSLPLIATAGDVVQELNKVITVGVVPNTYLIEVSMTSADPYESWVLVNAVVDSFLATNVEWSQGMTQNQIKVLDIYLKELESQTEELERKWKDLVKRGDPDEMLGMEVRNRNKPGGDAKPDEQGTGGRSITLEEYKRVRAELFQVDMDQASQQAWLTSARAAKVAAIGQAGQAADTNTDMVEERIKQQVVRRFQADADVQHLTERMMTAKSKVEEARRVIHRDGDPAEVAAARKLVVLKGQYDDLWAAKSRVFREEIELGTGRDGVLSPDQEIHDAEGKVKTLQARQAALKLRADNLEVNSSKQATDSVEIALLRDKRESLRSMQEQVIRKLEQLKFEYKGETRIQAVNPNGALMPTRPVSDKRYTYLAMTPLGVLGTVLGLIVLLEIRAGRVADPDALSSRIKHEVFSIAPLPNIRPGDDPNDDKAEQRLARFVQSLDHLRVAICEGGIPGQGRCVMITSATGGEGKTTLSAHLAARCANAGTSTLLIDADMRRASLGRLLDVPPGPGLGDVLGGDIDLDEALITLQAGGFHFLSAGTPGRDPSRVLKSTRLSDLISRLRQTYDLVIIDTPPVLPVADALILGRWADGAVMAARFDASRLPLVERANRQLALAGIPILGVVVNGVKGQDASYGNYAYSYNYYSGRSQQPPGTPSA